MFCSGFSFCSRIICKLLCWWTAVAGQRDMAEWILRPTVRPAHCSVTWIILGHREISYIIAGVRVVTTCEPNPCLNEGDCVMDFNTRRGACVCRPPFRGTFCESLGKLMLQKTIDENSAFSNIYMLRSDIWKCKLLVSWL